MDGPHPRHVVVGLRALPRQPPAQRRLEPSLQQRHGLRRRCANAAGTGAARLLVMERGRQRPRKPRKISGNLQKLGVFHGQNGLLMFEAKHGGETSKRQKVVEARNMAKKNETGAKHKPFTNLDAPASRRTWQIFKGHYSQMSYQSYHSQRHNFNSPPDPACNP